MYTRTSYYLEETCSFCCILFAEFIAPQNTIKDHKHHAASVGEAGIVARPRGYEGWESVDQTQNI